MSDYRPPAGFYFNLKFNGLTAADVDASFKEVKGLSYEMSTQELKEGGENRFHHTLPGRMKYSNLELSRGLVVWSSPVFTWIKENMAGAPLKVTPKNIVLNLLNTGSANPLASWSFVRAYPIKWSIPNGFESTSNSVVIESLTLAYQYFEADFSGGGSWDKVFEPLPTKVQLHGKGVSPIKGSTQG